MHNTFCLGFMGILTLIIMWAFMKDCRQKICSAEEKNIKLAKENHELKQEKHETFRRLDKIMARTNAEDFS